jgi:hypothetical protein
MTRRAPVRYVVDNVAGTGEYAVDDAASTGILCGGPCLLHLIVQPHDEQGVQRVYDGEPHVQPHDAALGDGLQLVVRPRVQPPARASRAVPVPA